MSRSDIPDWVRTACNRWGRQKRRIWTGHDWHKNVDGYAESLLGRIRDERDGAWQGLRSQRWPEVFWGDGLDVQRALIGMPEAPLAVMHVHYVWDPEWCLVASKKAALLDMSLRRFWEELKKGEIWIFARLDCAHTQVAVASTEISREDLKPVQRTATNAATAIGSPNLSFEALQRPKLSIPNAS